MLRQFHPLITALVHGAWVQYVRRCNREAMGSTTDLAEFLFGSERSALTLLRPALVDLQGGRCFYCDGPVRAGGHVDHFVPWSRYPTDLGHNLVVAHDSYNSAKGSMLAAEEHLARWMERNKAHSAVIEGRCAAANIRCRFECGDPACSVGLWAGIRCRQHDMAQSKRTSADRAELGDDLMLRLVTRQGAASLALLFLAAQMGFAWGHEGHKVVALIAEHYMTSAALAKTRDLLGAGTIDSVASWADDYRRDHPESGPWHYINVPLTDSKIDMARDCPNAQCVIAPTEHFLSVLRDASADQARKAEALKFVIHFVGDLHQPLHDEDNGDKGGNTRQVILHGHPDNLHWVWDTGLLEHINGSPDVLSAELEQRIPLHRILQSGSTPVDLRSFQTGPS